MDLFQQNSVPVKVLQEISTWKAEGAGADPENFHGRWLMGWLPIVNHTGARGVAG